MLPVQSYRLLHFGSGEWDTPGYHKQHSEQYIEPSQTTPRFSCIARVVVIIAVQKGWRGWAMKTMVIRSVGRGARGRERGKRGGGQREVRERDREREARGRDKVWARVRIR